MGEPGVPTVEQYCADALQEGEKLGLCGLTASCQLVRGLQKVLDPKGVAVCTLNLEDELWTENRPPLPATPAWLLPAAYAGATPAEKLARLRAKLAELGCTAQMVGKLDNLAWLLNLRAMDIECTPYAMAYCFVTQTEAVLFLNSERLAPEAASELAACGVRLAGYDDVLSFIAGYSEPQTVLAEPASVNYAVFSALEANPALTVQSLPDPLLPMKGVKNATELEHARECHIRDAVAMVRFQKELEERLEAGETLHRADGGRDAAQIPQRPGQVPGGELWHHRGLRPQCGHDALPRHRGRPRRPGAPGLPTGGLRRHLYGRHHRHHPHLPPWAP